jgi:hypothetical protein
MPKFGWIILILGISWILSCNQKQAREGDDTMAKFVPDEISGWVLKGESENYDTTTIFDYINGAGEVYLAYNFTNVAVYRYQKADAPELTVEIFDMVSDENAFGVFTYSRESESTGIGQVYEQVGGLICFWQGHYYVCVKAEETTDETKNAVELLAKAIDGNLPQSGNKPKLINYLPTDNLNENSIRYLRTFSALNYHYYLASENILGLDNNTEAVLAEYQADPRYYLLLIKYSSAEKAATADSSFRENYLTGIVKDENVLRLESGLWTGATIYGEYLVIILDAGTKEMAANMLLNAANNIKGK